MPPSQHQSVSSSGSLRGVAPTPSNMRMLCNNIQESAHPYSDNEWSVQWQCRDEWSVLCSCDFTHILTCFSPSLPCFSDFSLSLRVKALSMVSRTPAILIGMRTARRSQAHVSGACAVFALCLDGASKPALNSSSSVCLSPLHRLSFRRLSPCRQSRCLILAAIDSAIANALARSPLPPPSSPAPGECYHRSYCSK